jgi:outer membrane protein OmpA-like peptidoglycan-associated protein
VQKEDKMNWLKVCLALSLAAVVGGCADTQNVRGKPVPTAFFVFFDEGSAAPTADSLVVLDEAAAYLKQYDNTAVRVVGHVSPDETQANLDQERASRVAEELVKRGAQPVRMQLVGAGSTENVSGTAGIDDTSVDHRVDILFSAM